MFAMAMAATIAGIAVPAALSTIDELRTAMAARYVAGRIGTIRLDAVRRSAAVALVFQATADGDYRFAPYADGNGNGVRSSDVGLGVDRALAPFERLSDKFPGIRFELMSGVPDADGNPGGGQSGVRLGSA